MSSMKPERNRLSVRRAQPALRADNEEFLASEFRRVPTHAGVLSQPEQIPTGAIEEHFGGERKPSFRSLGLRRQAINLLTVAGENFRRNAHRDHCVIPAANLHRPNLPAHFVP